MNTSPSHHNPSHGNRGASNDHPSQIPKPLLTTSSQPYTTPHNPSLPLTTPSQPLTTPRYPSQPAHNPSQPLTTPSQSPHHTQAKQEEASPFDQLESAHAYVPLIWHDKLVWPLVAADFTGLEPHMLPMQVGWGRSG